MAGINQRISGRTARISEQCFEYLIRTIERAFDWAKSTHLLLANDFLQRGIEASKKSQKEFARRNFLQAIAHDEENETAWLWLASVSDSVEEKNIYLRKVLNLNPENENALVDAQIR